MKMKITVQFLKISLLVLVLCFGKMDSFGQREVANENSTQTTASGVINGHEYVDLGLSVKWATCNVGANSPEEYGNYYAWGEIEPKEEYTEENSATYGKSMGDIAGDSCYDAARANWGGTWRLPTKKEIEELINNCTIEWTTCNDIKGCLVKSKINNNSIFFPTAGWYHKSALGNTGENGYYWSSSPYGTHMQNAYYLSFLSGLFDWDWYDRSIGRSVRPVSE